MKQNDYVILGVLLGLGGQAEGFRLYKELKNYIGKKELKKLTKNFKKLEKSKYINHLKTEKGWY